MIHESVFIAPGAVVCGDIDIGRDASVWYNCVLRADMAPIRIGACSNIQDLSLLHVDADLPCLIGDRVSVGHRAILHGCTVEDDCLIGMGAILLNGVSLGRGSVVAAGAVVREGMQVDPGSLLMGIPARVVRRTDDALRHDIEFGWQHYVQQALDHRQGRVRHFAPTPLADPGR